jgi:plastocyanin
MRLLVCLLMTLSFAGCMTADANEVSLGDNYFDRPGADRNGETTAAVGDRFTFQNEGNNQHTVTVHRPPDASTTFLLDAVLEPGETASFTFDEAGVYHVYCRFHGSFTQGMRLAVVVS